MVLKVETLPFFSTGASKINKISKFLVVDLMKFTQYIVIEQIRICCVVISIQHKFRNLVQLFCYCLTPSWYHINNFYKCILFTSYNAMMKII